MSKLVDNGISVLGLAVMALGPSLLSNQFKPVYCSELCMATQWCGPLIVSMLDFMMLFACYSMDSGNEASNVLLGGVGGRLCPS